MSFEKRDIMVIAPILVKIDVDKGLLKEMNGLRGELFYANPGL